MRRGWLLVGVIILILSASFYYVQKPLATPANPEAGVVERSLQEWWSVGGMILGALVIIVALFYPRYRMNPMRSPMKEYARTSAAQDDSGYDFFH